MAYCVKKIAVIFVFQKGDEYLFLKREHTGAADGFYIYDTIKNIGDIVDDEEYINACINIFKFRNKFEYALFKIYNKNFEFKQKNKGGCIHCGSDMGKNLINCRVCATLQIDGKEIMFDGENR